MEKHLVPFGNSLGLVIERSICKLLGLTKNTRLEITTDGRRILIEPVGAPVILPAERLDAVRVVRAVAQRMSNELHQRLHPRLAGHGACTMAVVWAQGVMDDPQPGDELFVRRYRVCLDAWHAGASWEDSVMRAVSEVSVPEEILATASARSR